ncbi:MAG: hypothetical protein ACT4QF_00255 [Sporichthyaceae bacterium]
MPITNAKAVEIAKKYRLTITDAESLARMAEDDADAERIAAALSDDLEDYGAIADQAMSNPAGGRIR